MTCWDISQTLFTYNCGLSGLPSQRKLFLLRSLQRFKQSPRGCHSLSGSSLLLGACTSFGSVLLPAPGRGWGGLLGDRWRTTSCSHNLFCSSPWCWDCFFPYMILAFLGLEGMIRDGNYLVSEVPLWFLAMIFLCFCPACAQQAENRAATAMGRHRRGLGHLRAHLLSPTHPSSFNKSCYLLVQDMAGLLCLPSPTSLQSFFWARALSLPSSSHPRWFAAGGHAWHSPNVRYLLEARACSESSWMLRKARIP